MSNKGLSPIGRSDNEFKGAVCEKSSCPNKTAFSTGSRKCIKKNPQVTALGEEHLLQMCRIVWVWAELEGFDLLVPTLFPHPPKEGKVFGLGF